jgi:signal peptidase II
VFLIDQLSKWYVVDILRLHERLQIAVLPIFDLTWVRNFGVSMGLLTASSNVARWMLVALTGVIAAGVALWLWRERKTPDMVALGLVLGGALGNILDRVRLGYVADFLDLHFGDLHPFLVFNVADAAITVGVLLLLLRAFLTRDAADRSEK